MVKEPVFYVTPDPLKACGLEAVLPNLHLITLFDHPILSTLKRKGVSIFTLEENGVDVSPLAIKNTGQMLGLEQVERYIRSNSNTDSPYVLVFKPSHKIDLIAQTRGYTLLGNPCALSEIFEEKTSFWQITQNLGLPTPPGMVARLKDVDYSTVSAKLGMDIVIQFGRGWAGNSTFFVHSQQDYDQVVVGNELRDVKITKIIDGDTYINNVCIVGDTVLISSPAIQLPDPKGVNRAATYGRQWGTKIDTAVGEQLVAYSLKLGKYIGNVGFRGWLGFDFLVTKSGEVFISECNARLTASTAFYTQCEIKLAVAVPLFYYHCAAFLRGAHTIQWERSDFSASEFVTRNETEADIIISSPPKTGIYTLEDNPIFDREGEGILETGENEVFLGFGSKGESVAANEALAVAQLDHTVYEDGHYTSVFDKVANIIGKLSGQTNA